MALRGTIDISGRSTCARRHFGNDLVRELRRATAGSIVALASIEMHRTTPAIFERVLTVGEKQALHHTVFRNRALVGVDLAGADLREALFEGVVLERCDLTGADLRGARFVLCDLREVVMFETQLEGARFEGTILRGVVGLSESERVEITNGGGIEQPLHASDR